MSGISPDRYREMIDRHLAGDLPSHEFELLCDQIESGEGDRELFEHELSQALGLEELLFSTLKAVADGASSRSETDPSASDPNLAAAERSQALKGIRHADSSGFFDPPDLARVDMLLSGMLSEDQESELRCDAHENSVLASELREADRLQQLIAETFYLITQPRSPARAGMDLVDRYLAGDLEATEQAELFSAVEFDSELMAELDTTRSFEVLMRETFQLAGEGALSLPSRSRDTGAMRLSDVRQSDGDAPRSGSEPALRRLQAPRTKRDDERDSDTQLSVIDEMIERYLAGSLKRSEVNVLLEAARSSTAIGNKLREADRLVWLLREGFEALTGQAAVVRSTLHQQPAGEASEASANDTLVLEFAEGEDTEVAEPLRLMEAWPWEPEPLRNVAGESFRMPIPRAGRSARLSKSSGKMSVPANPLVRAAAAAARKRRSKVPMIGSVAALLTVAFIASFYFLQVAWQRNGQSTDDSGISARSERGEARVADASERDGGPDASERDSAQANSSSSEGAEASALNGQHATGDSAYLRDRTHEDAGKGHADAPVVPGEDDLDDERKDSRAEAEGEELPGVPRKPKDAPDAELVEGGDEQERDGEQPRKMVDGDQGDQVELPEPPTEYPEGGAPLLEGADPVLSQFNALQRQDLMVKAVDQILSLQYDDGTFALFTRSERRMVGHKLAHRDSWRAQVIAGNALCVQALIAASREDDLDVSRQDLRRSIEKGVNGTIQIYGSVRDFHDVKYVTNRDIAELMTMLREYVRVPSRRGKGSSFSLNQLTPDMRAAANQLVKLLRERYNEDEQMWGFVDSSRYGSATERMTPSGEAGTTLTVDLNTTYYAVIALDAACDLGLFGSREDRAMLSDVARKLVDLQSADGPKEVGVKAEWDRTGLKGDRCSKDRKARGWTFSGLKYSESDGRRLTRNGATTAGAVCMLTALRKRLNKQSTLSEEELTEMECSVADGMAWLARYYTLKGNPYNRTDSAFSMAYPIGHNLYLRALSESMGMLDCSVLAEHAWFADLTGTITPMVEDSSGEGAESALYAGIEVAQDANFAMRYANAAILLADRQLTNSEGQPVIPEIIEE